MIGADVGLKGTSRSPLSSLATPGYSAAPPMITDRAVQGSVNNTLASSAGSDRAALQEMDRAGISRGRGQQFRADMAQAGADSKARAGAAGAEMEAANSNAAARLAYDSAMQNEQLSNQGLLENLRHSRSMEDVAKQGWRQSLAEAQRKGQYGLDSLQPAVSLLNVLLQ